MNLDKITVNVRPLNSYQAMDLGMMMARRWFFPLWQLWWRRMLPMILLFFVVVVYRTWAEISGFFGVWLMLIGLYVCRPYADMAIVVYLSQKLFNHDYTVEQAWQQLKTMPNTGIFSTFIYLFTHRKSIVMPIILLEGQTRKQRKARLKILTKSKNNAIAWHTSIFQVVELFLYIGIWVMCYQLIPESLFDQIAFSVLFEEMSWLLTSIILTIYLLVTSILSVFFMASGFAIYICKRSELEGWDIELKFRQLAQRHAELQQSLQRGGHHVD